MNVLVCVAERVEFDKLNTFLVCDLGTTEN